MGIFSQKCVTCKERSKRVSEHCTGTDENGEEYQGDLYDCNNSYCEIQQKRRKTEKSLLAAPRSRAGSVNRKNKK